MKTMALLALFSVPLLVACSMQASAPTADSFYESCTGTFVCSTDETIVAAQKQGDGSCQVSTYDLHDDGTAWDANGVEYSWSVYSNGDVEVANEQTSAECAPHSQASCIGIPKSCVLYSVSDCPVSSVVYCSVFEDAYNLEELCSGPAEPCGHHLLQQECENADGCSWQ